MNANTDTASISRELRRLAIELRAQLAMTSASIETMAAIVATIEARLAEQESSR